MIIMICQVVLSIRRVMRRVKGAEKRATITAPAVATNITSINRT